MGFVAATLRGLKLRPAAEALVRFGGDGNADLFASSPPDAPCRILRPPKNKNHSILDLRSDEITR